jgi:hypothetical protein
MITDRTIDDHQKRYERLMRRPLWPIYIPMIDLIQRVGVAFKCGADTEFQSRLWGKPECVIYRALHIYQERRLSQNRT